MPELILLISVSIYFISFVLLTAGIRKGDTTDFRTGEPTVSVVVAARNEENTIERCIRSILACGYPRERLQVVLVNDSSDDRTGEIMQKFADGRGVVYTETKRSNTSARGKAQALAIGVREAQNELILFTDADCEVPVTWIRKLTGYFDPSTGLVGGFTMLKSSGWFGKMQTVDWFFLYSVAAGVMGLGRPVTAIGNNLAVRRVAYDETGGYENLPFSVTEDYILVEAIRKTGKWRMKFPLDPETLVTSRPCGNLNELFRQKHRWATGSGDMQAGAFAVFLPLYLVHLMLPFFFIFHIHPAIALLSLAVKLLADAVLLYRPLRLFKLLSVYRYFLHFEALLTVYVLILPFQVLFKRKVIWKERTYDT